MDVMQQTACLVVNPITVGSYAFLFNCKTVGRDSDSMTAPPKHFFSGLLPDAMSFAGPTVVQLVVSLALAVIVMYYLPRALIFVSSQRFNLISMYSLIELYGPNNYNCNIIAQGEDLRSKNVLSPQ